MDNYGFKNILKNWQSWSGVYVSYSNVYYFPSCTYNKIQFIKKNNQTHTLLQMEKQFEGRVKWDTVFFQSA